MSGFPGFNMYPAPAISMDTMLRRLHETMKLPCERQAGFTFQEAEGPAPSQAPRPNAAVQEAEGPAPSQAPRPAAPDARPNAAEKMHFIDRYREGIISGGGNVAPILDRLYSLNLLTMEKYQTVLAENIPQAQIRVLYNYMHSWSRTDKDTFFDALMEFERPLIRKLLEE